MVVLALAACSKGRITDNHWAETLEALDQLDDSIVKRSSSVPEMIRQGLSSAHDSIEWYAYYIRWATVFSLGATPDSLLTYTRKTLAFTDRKMTSADEIMRRRLYVLAGHAYESEASYYQHYRIQNDTVFKKHRQAYEMFKESDEQSMLPIVCANLADAYALHNRLPEASSWYRRALWLTDSLQLDYSVKNSIYMGLGRIYLNLLDYEKADYYYKQAGERFDSMPPHEQLYYLNNYGNFFFYQQQYDAAFEQFRQMEQLLHRIGAEDTFEMFLCLVNMGDVYLNQGKLDKALSCVDRAEPFFRKNKVTEAVYYCQIIRFGVAARKGDIREAERLLPIVMEEYPTEEGITDIRDRYVFDYFIKKGEIRKALQIKFSNEQRNDSIKRDRDRMRAKEIMLRVSDDTLQLHRQLETARQKAEVQRAYLGTILMATLLIILLFLLFIWWMHIRRKQTQHELDLLRMQLLSIRQRISPHFVFNVLNHRIAHAQEDEEKEIIKLVRLIRANLNVSSNTLITVDEELRFVKDYIELEQELVEDLNYTVDVDPGLNLSDLMIPSMFVQILTENAIKHGLKGLQGEKRLSIRVERQASAFKVTVTDNGRGFNTRAVKGTTTGSGLSIIRQTMDIFNSQHPEVDMTMEIRDLSDDAQHPAGCEAVLVIPYTIRNLQE